MANPKHKEKIYCYVDETGQHTEGQLFFVAVVILDKERDELRRQLSEIESNTGKHSKKWSRSTTKQREAYMRRILSRPGLAGRLFYSMYQETRAYVDLTILSTAKAIHTRTPNPYDATILVDGLRRTEQHRFASGLRKLRVSVRKVRGLTDESDVFIRLADALVGFVRDSLEGNSGLASLYQQAIDSKKIREV